MRTVTSSRRALPLVALLAVVAPTAACGEAAPSEGTATPAGGSSFAETSSADPTDAAPASGAGAAASGHGVRLEATFAIGFPEQPTDPGVRKKPGVVVTYTLAREGAQGGELIAYDVVPDTLGSSALPPDLNPEHAWVHASGATVRLSKQGFAAAPGTTFIAAPVTGARVIPADHPLEGRAYAVSPAELDVPSREFTAPRGPLPSSSGSWQLCVQVGERLPGMRTAASVPTVPKGTEGTEGTEVLDVLAAPVRAPEGDELVCTPPVNLTLP
jgi:hypothetical protein